MWICCSVSAKSCLKVPQSRPFSRFSTCCSTIARPSRFTQWVDHRNDDEPSHALFVVGTSRNLWSALGQNANMLSSISHLLPQGTSITTVLSILNLLNNLNQLTNDVHQIPVLINQTLVSIFNGAGQIVVQQLLDLVGAQSQGSFCLPVSSRTTNITAEESI